MLSLHSWCHDDDDTSEVGFSLREMDIFSSLPVLALSLSGMMLKLTKLDASCVPTEKANI